MRTAALSIAIGLTVLPLQAKADRLRCVARDAVFVDDEGKLRRGDAEATQQLVWSGFVIDTSTGTMTLEDGDVREWVSLWTGSKGAFVAVEKHGPSPLTLRIGAVAEVRRAVFSISGIFLITGTCVPVS